MARYIDAQNLNGYEFGLMSPKAQKLFHRIINEAPTEDVVPIVHAHWIFVGTKIAKCSNCNMQQDTFYGENYCPTCGAKMGGRESEEEE